MKKIQKRELKKKFKIGDFSLLDDIIPSRNSPRLTPEYYKNILKLFQEKKLTCLEIAKGLNKTQGSVNAALRRMKQARQAGCISVDDWFVKGYRKISG